MGVRDGPFHPLRIEAVAGDPEATKRHIDAFVRVFIRPEARERASHVIFKLAPRHPDRLGDLHRLLDDRYTGPPQDLRLPPSLPDSGLYFDGKNSWVLTLADAELVSGYLCRDALWFGISGRYAAFLHHEWRRWLCYRPSRTV
jgi:hypothetical protein